MGLRIRDAAQIESRNFIRMIFVARDDMAWDGKRIAGQAGSLIGVPDAPALFMLNPQI